MDNKKRIEIEFRAMFSKERHDELKRFLDENAQHLGIDNKDVYFFILPDKLLKVVDNVSQKNAEIVLKLNTIGTGSDFEEIEIPISPSNIKKAIDMFTYLGFTDIMHTFQERRNYLYKDVELALKYSDTWGYHIELEILIDDHKKQLEAETRIHEIAHELNISLMTDKELREFTVKAKDNYKKGIYPLKRVT